MKTPRLSLSACIIGLAAGIVPYACKGSSNGGGAERGAAGAANAGAPNEETADGRGGSNIDSDGAGAPAGGATTTSSAGVAGETTLQGEAGAGATSFEWADWPMPNTEADVAAGAPNRMSYVDDGDGIVVDEVTGLSWEQTFLSATSQAEASSRCEALTLGGFEDWRLPRWIELLSLVNYDAQLPAIAAEYFPNTPSQPFWQTSKNRSFSFLTGASNLSSGSGINVRCVRSAPKPSHPHYEIEADIVHDVGTNLTWQRAVTNDNYDYPEATAHCASLDLHGLDWRIPTLKELQTLVDIEFTDGSEKPAFDTEAFPDAPAKHTVDFFWTSTLQVDRKYPPHWHVSGYDLRPYNNSAHQASHVRCVR